MFLHFRNQIFLGICEIDPQYLLIVDSLLSFQWFIEFDVLEVF